MPEGQCFVIEAEARKLGPRPVLQGQGKNLALFVGLLTSNGRFE